MFVTTVLVDVKFNVPTSMIFFLKMLKSLCYRISVYPFDVLVFGVTVFPTTTWCNFVKVLRDSLTHRAS